MPFSAQNLPELEAHLTNNPTLTEGGQPGPLDATIFFAIGKLPNLQTHPNLYFWYLHISTFSPALLKKWVEKTAPKKQEKKADDDFDPFADEGQTKTEQKPKPKVQAKKKKQKPVAKSIIVFDVKVYEQQYDLDGLWQKIKKQVVMDGLIWNENPKKIPVVGKVFKLQIGCVIEDDKVQTDDIFDKITAWEDDVQSIDVVSFNKL